jgi:signal transduction histidine kinase
VLNLLKKSAIFFKTMAARIGRPFEKPASRQSADVKANPGESRARLSASIVREQLGASIVLVLGIALSVIGFVTAQQYFRSGEQQEFERQAAHYIQTVVNSVQRYEEYILDLAHEFEGPTPMDRWQFDDYAEPRVKRHQGLLALAWIPFVSADRRGEFEAKAHDDGLSGFRIREQGETGDLIDAGPRDFYLPVYYALPFDLDREFLGVDLYSLEEFRPALDAAGEGGHPVVIPWSQHGNLRPAPTEFQIIRPVYDSTGIADIGAPRKQRLKGFVAGALQLDTIVESVVDELTTPAWLDIYVYRRHETVDTDILLFRPSEMRTEEASPLSRAEIAEGLFERRIFAIGDMELTVVVKPVVKKYSFESSILPYWVGSFGILLTLFTAYYLAATQNRARVIEQTVTERTAALSDANISLHNEILERQRAEMEMRRAKDQAEVANRAKSEFLAMVSHELRTPLNAIIGFSEMISQEVFGPVGNKKYKDYVGDISKSGTHLLGLINNILDLSKVESGRFGLTEQKVNLADGISETLRLVSKLAEAGDVKVNCTVPENLPELQGDRQAIRQILLNLLSNAIKFTEPDGHVRVDATIDGSGQLVLAIEDTGIGIPEESLDSVFEPFTQVDSALSRQFEGTGLGLPLTRSLVELHDGSVNLKSSLGEGTKVTVTFPRERVVGATTH